MKKERSAKIRALVVAFALIFSGFAALMAVPHSALGATGTIEITNVMATPEDAVEGDTVSISAEIANVTIADATDDVYVNIFDPTYSPGDAWANNTLTATETDGANMFWWNDTYNTVGMYNYTISAMNGDGVWANSANHTFWVNRTPVINSASATPQEVGQGNMTSISADVENATDVQVNMTHPDGSMGNHVMEYNDTKEMWYFNTTYLTIGEYTNHIYAWNTSNGVDIESAEFKFWVNSTGAPIGTASAVSPENAAVGEMVDFTATVENTTYDGLTLNITKYNTSDINEMWEYNMSVDFNSIDYYYTLDTMGWSAGMYNYSFIGLNETGTSTTSPINTFNLTEKPVLNSTSVEEVMPDKFKIVADVINADNVMVNVTRPDESYTGYKGMTHDVNDTYYYMDMFYEVGVYNYTIWANNSANDEEITSSVYQFTNGLTTTVTPEVAFAGSEFNITAEVYEGNEVKVNVTMPDGSESETNMNHLENESYYYSDTYSDLGVYNYTIKWNTTSDDTWKNSSVHHFEVRDVLTKDATGIEANRATLNAEFKNMTEAGMTENATIYYLWNDGPTVNETTAEATGDLVNHTYSNTTGEEAGWTDSFELTGLEKSTTYYYRAVTNYSGDVEMGNIEKFTTLPIAGIDGPDSLDVLEDGTFTSTSEGDRAKTTWTVDGTEVATGASFDYNFTMAGAHTVGINVTDSLGQTNSTTLEVTALADIVVTLKDDTSGDAITGANVTLTPWAGDDYTPNATDNGNYTFTDMSTSDFALLIEHSDYNFESLNYTGFEATGEGEISVVVEMTKRSTWPVEIGPVKTENNETAFGADVTLSHGGSDLETKTVEEATGMVYFDVDFKPEGEDFEVSVSHPDYPTFTMTFTDDSSGPITLEMFELVIGPVQDSDGNAIEDAGVEFTYDGTDYSEITRNDGEAIFGLPFDATDMNFTVTVEHEEYQTKTVDVGANEAITLDALVTEQTVSVGPIKDNAGNFVEGATVNLSWSGGSMEATTNANGIAEFTVDFDPSNTDFTATISHEDLDEDKEITFTGSSPNEATTIDVGEEEGAGGGNMMLYAGVGIVVIIIIIVVVLMMMKKPAEGPMEEEFGEEEEFVEEDIGEEEELFEEEEEEDLFGEEEEEGFAEEEGEEELFEEEEEEDLFDEDEEL